jgi:hypothetical protein
MLLTLILIHYNYLYTLILILLHNFAVGVLARSRTRAFSPFSREIAAKRECTQGRQRWKGGGAEGRRGGRTEGSRGEEQGADPRARWRTVRRVGLNE